MIWRPAQRSDVPALADFVATVERTWPASRELGIAAIEARLDRTAEPADSLLTLDPAGEIVGYADVIDIGVVDGVHRIGLTVVPSPRMSAAVRREQLDRLIAGAHEIRDRRRAVEPAVLGIRRAVADSMGQQLLAELGFTVVSELRTLHRALDEPTAAPPDSLPIIAYSAEFEDAARLVHNAAFHDIPSAGQPDPAQWRQLYVGMPAFLPELSFLAVDGDTVRGLLLTWGGDVEHPRQLRIPTVATVPAQRRRGIATALLTHAFEHYRRAGYTSVILDVDAGNEPAEALYARAGFVNSHGGYTFYSRPL